MVPDCWEIEGQIVGILARYSDFSYWSPTLGWPVNLYPASSLSSGSAASPYDWSLPLPPSDFSSGRFFHHTQMACLFLLPHPRYLMVNRGQGLQI